jgi:hypothetical protein
MVGEILKSEIIHPLLSVNLDEAQRQIGLHTEYSIMSARSA